MSLLITIVKAPDSIAVKQRSISLGEHGGTLGRGDENTWVLDDPELYLSSLHCQFSFEAGQYYITDQSTNGTFYNGSVDPMGKGSTLPVQDGNRFIIGDYEFSIEVQGSASSAIATGLSGLDSPFSTNDAFGSPSSAGLDDFASSPFNEGSAAAPPPIFSPGQADSDPLAALDKARGGSTPQGFSQLPPALGDLFSAPTHSDGASPLNQQLDWPTPAANPTPVPNNVIPDDWDDDTLGGETRASPAAPAFNNTPPPADEAPFAADTARQAADAADQLRVLERVNQKLLAEIDTLKYKLAQKPAVSSNSSNNVDTVFINALGFGDKQLDDTAISQINQLAGEVMREMVAGMMQVLGSRSSIKNEFRMNVTTIQPVENNPLKFSANVDDALENMFLKQGNAFKQPMDAVHECFNGVAEHQVAIIAGIREAFKAVIERFDPVILEERFAKQHKGGILPGSHKAKNWDAFVDYYNELAGDIDKSFQYLFGNGFVRAYEAQLQKLAVSRKAKINK
ncbi:MAG: type VI secretion system-associated FHA domain protein TagH [Gammaproteobacteria bacterium]|nr:type VI secretion system-associated FHA domain protein TagH [Gammaproteobacteria bacterium]